MKYGYFDTPAKEYVITRPDTPTPWLNYLGTGKYSGIVSQTGGGTSFYIDPMNMRILRYRINSFPEDRPGRYLYIRDMDSGEYWSATWAPVQKADRFECRHGRGYTRITTGYDGIVAEVLYFVAPDSEHEYWHLQLRNESGRPRRLRVYSYAEFSFYLAQMDLSMGWTPSAS